jgi:aryl-alcohol dehydrogenase-like predicted oxidoreductase
VLEQVAKSHNATLAQISLAWMINKEDFIIPIPGSRKIDRLISNYHAGDITLSKEEMNLLEEKLNTMTFDVFGGHK